MAKTLISIAIGSGHMADDETIETLIEEQGDETIRMGTDWQDNPLGDPLSLDEFERFSNAVDHHIAPPTLENDQIFQDMWSDVEYHWQEYPGDVKAYFGGELSPPGYIDTVYVAYDDLGGSVKESFEKYMVIHFKGLMNTDPEKNAGICPICDDRITLNNEMFRYVEDDQQLRANPDEFDFREYDGYGSVCRMWWD